MTDTQTHGAHCVHIADWCDLEAQVCRTRTKLKDAVFDLDDIKHAVVHAKDPETVDNLITQLQSRLLREVGSITETLNKGKR